MIKRYPHCAVLINRTETESADGLTGNDETKPDERRVVGRYESKDSFSKSYIAKFYTNQLGIKEFCKDGTIMQLFSREFQVSKVSLHQTHTELWLN